MPLRRGVYSYIEEGASWDAPFLIEIPKAFHKYFQMVQLLKLHAFYGRLKWIGPL